MNDVILFTHGLATSRKHCESGSPRREVQFPRVLHRFVVTAFEWRRFGRLIMATAIVGIVLSGEPADAALKSCAGADLVQSAAKSFAAASLTRSPEVFAHAIANYSDTNAIALFALGPFRNKLPPARREEYFAEVRAFMGRFFADHAGTFSNANLQIANCDSGQIRSVAGSHQIVWKTSGGRVGDVEVDGVWLADVLRSRFVSVIDNGQGNMESLFKYLKQSS